MPTRRKYRIRIATRGASTVSGNVDFTLYSGDSAQTSTLATHPAIQGPKVRPLDGKSETLSTTFDVADKDGTLTAELADGDGRMHLVGRLVQVQTADSTDGGGSFGSWTTIATGRLTDLSEGEHRGRYTVQVSDERWVERRATLWTSGGGTTMLAPSGVISDYGSFDATDPANAEILDASDANHVVVVFRQNDRARIPETVAAFLEDDLISGADASGGDGNFTHARINIDSTDYEIVEFAPELGTRDFFFGLIDDNETEDTVVWTVVVYAPSHAFNDEDQVQAYLHAPTAPASEATPFHIGGEDGTHPFQVLKDIYDGTYGDATVRYDSTAMSALISDDRYPKVRFRITETAKVAEWVEEHIYRPFGVVPFIGADGEVVPTQTWLPQDTDPTSLTTVTASDCATGGLPTWEHTSRDAVTVIRASYPNERVARLDEAGRAGDAIRTMDFDLADETHDTASTLGRRVWDIRLAGYHFHTQASITTELLARETFNRYGDGPIRGRMTLTETGASGIAAGDHIVLDQDTLKSPNPSTNARTGDRVVLVLRTVTHPSRVGVEFLDAGPDDQPLSAPTVSLAQNSGTPEHIVDATVGSLDADADGWVLLVDRGDGKGYVVGKTGTSAGTVEVPECPSGTTITAKVYATAQNRIRSANSTTDSVATASLTAPSSLTATGSNTDATGTWTNGESAYPVEVLLDGTRRAILDPGSTRYTMTGLDASTTYNSSGFEVRHRDEYGGTSSKATDSFTTGTQATAPDVAGVDARVREVFSFFGKLLVVEIQVWLFASDPAYGFDVQLADDSSGTNAEIIGKPDGSVRVYKYGHVATGDTKYVRIRHRRDGYANGSWSCWKAVDLTDAAEKVEERQAVPVKASALLAGDSFTLTVTDPQCRHTAAEFSTDGGSTWVSTWDSETESGDDTEYEEAITGTTDWRVVGYDADGTSRTLFRDAVRPGDAIQPPTVDIEATVNADDVDFDIDATAGDGGSSLTFEYRYKVDSPGSPGSYSSWASMGAGTGSESVTETVSRPTSGLPDSLWVEVRYTEAPDIVGRAFHPVDPITDIDDDTGATEPTDNLLTTGWDEQSWTGSFDRFYNDGGFDLTVDRIQLEDVGLEVGDRVALYGEAKGDGGEVELQVRFYDSGDSVTDSALTGRTSSTSYTDLSVTDTVPASSVSFAVRGLNHDFSTNTAYLRHVVLKRGRVVGPPRPPVFQFHRNDLDRVGDGSTYGRTKATALTSGEVDLAQSGVIGKIAGNLEYGSSGSGTTVESLKPAEADAEQNPPSMGSVALSVADDGTDDDYTLTWSSNSAVTGSYDVDAEFFREGTSVGTKQNVTATNDTMAFTDSGGGDGASDNHHAVVQLLDGSGDVVQTVTTREILSTF